MNVQERIEALEAEFNEKLKALKAEAQQEFPKDGDGYWCIEDSTEVGRFIWDGDDFDNELLAVGNVFHTEQQAEFAVEKLKVEAELRKFGRPFERGEINQYIFLDTDSDRIDVENRYHFPTQGTIYFESEEKVQHAIEAVGKERIKKYIFGVED